MASYVGLDIGTSAVRAVQISPGGKGPATLDRLGQVMLPAGAVRDGEIVQPEAVVEALRTLWQRYGFKGRKVALGLASQQVVVRQVDLPYLPENELRQSLQFQAQDYIPIPMDQATLDFHVLEHYQTEDGQQFSRILLVAASKAQVDTLVQVATRAKLTPVLLDLDAFAMLRALAPRHAIEGGTGEVLIDIGTSVTNIVIHEAGVPRFVRILLMGGGQITDTLVSALGLSYEQAENTKAAAQPVDSPEVPVDEADRIVVERANRFVDEIRGSLDYYAAQADAVQVRRVLITGGGSQLPGLAGRLSEAIRLPVDRGHPMAELKIGNVGLAPEQLVDAEPYLTVAIGLALGAAE